MMESILKCLFYESGVLHFAQKMWLVWRVYYVQKLSYLDTKYILMLGIEHFLFQK